MGEGVGGGNKDGLGKKDGAFTSHAAPQLSGVSHLRRKLRQ